MGSWRMRIRLIRANSIFRIIERVDLAIQQSDLTANLLMTDDPYIDRENNKN